MSRDDHKRIAQRWLRQAADHIEWGALDALTEDDLDRLRILCGQLHGLLRIGQPTQEDLDAVAKWIDEDPEIQATLARIRAETGGAG